MHPGDVCAPSTLTRYRTVARHGNGDNTLLHSNGQKTGAWMLPRGAYSVAMGPLTAALFHVGMMEKAALLIERHNRFEFRRGAPINYNHSALVGFNLDGEFSILMEQRGQIGEIDGHVYLLARVHYVTGANDPTGGP